LSYKTPVRNGGKQKWGSSQKREFTRWWSGQIEGKKGCGRGSPRGCKQALLEMARGTGKGAGRQEGKTQVIEVLNRMVYPAERDGGWIGTISGKRVIQNCGIIKEERMRRGSRNIQEQGGNWGE